MYKPSRLATLHLQNQLLVVFENSSQQRSREANGLPWESPAQHSGGKATIPSPVCSTAGVLAPRPIVHVKAEV